MGGNPFQINIFFGSLDPKNFYDSRSKNFVGSVFNFGGSFQNSHCSKSSKQQTQDNKAICQLPATLVYHYNMSEYEKLPTLSYVVVDSQGKVRAHFPAINF